MKTGSLVLVVMIAFLVFAGCASEPKDLTSQKLPATTPDQVKFYQKKPGNYGVVGEVQLPITRDMAWDENSNNNKAFDLMKAQAAAMGANGILFYLEEGQFDLTVNAGYHGKFFEVPIRRGPPRTVVAKAIWVNAN